MTGPQRPRARGVALALVVVLATATVPAAVVGQSDDDEKSFIDAAVDDEDDDLSAMLARALAERTGGAAKFIARLTTPDDATAADYAANATETFNDENVTIESWANEQLEASSDRDVFRVCFHDRDDGAATRYVVANVSNGSWTDTRVVTPSTFDGLNRTVDYNVSLDWYASQNADDELATFVEKFAVQEQNISSAYRARKAATYGDSVESDLWGPTPERCPA